MGMWDFINRYHEHMNARIPVSSLNFGLPIGPDRYPGMSFLIQGAGRGVEDIGRKFRYLQAADAAAILGVTVENGARAGLFSGPKDVAGHKRMMHNLAAMGIPVSGFGRGIVMHRGTEADFKWNDPRDRDMTKAILTVQKNSDLRKALRDLFDVRPDASPDAVFELFVRKFDEPFRDGIRSEVTEWLDGYQLEFQGNSEILGTQKTPDGRILVNARNRSGEYAFIVDMLVTSLGSKGITLPVEEKRAPDGTFLTAQVRGKDGRVVPVVLAGMSYDGRGAVGPSVKHAEKVSHGLHQRIVKLNGNSAPDKNTFQHATYLALEAQLAADFSGDILKLLVRPDRPGAFPEFFPES
jgi:hypothetical protein